MQRQPTLLIASLLLVATSGWATPSSTEDRLIMRGYYQQLFPQLLLDDYAEGVYAIDNDAKSSWLAIEEFPPYELGLEQGEQLFNTPFTNGARYADCFANKGIAIAQNYPYWDPAKQAIITLASALNDCRQANQLPALVYGKGEITYLLAYMAFTSRGQRVSTQVPGNSAAAQNAYQQGKTYFYQRRGQLNFSCASCHLDNAGKFIRSEILSPALGHTTHWPAYRLNTGELGTLHRRFMVCNKLIRATVDPAQSPKLRQLEYFLSSLDYGLPLNGPSTRK